MTVRQRKYTSFNCDSHFLFAATRPLTIAEQIEALTKKKPKKPLKEGQMGLTGCARAMLILTNIMFLVGNTENP